MTDSVYEFAARRLEGNMQSLGDFTGDVLLIVNTASRCGFTPQYEGLEALQQRYVDRGFKVLGFPCNQFGSQEPGDEHDIATFCQSNYGVTFPMFAKVSVNGQDAHPLYRYLKSAIPGLMGTQGIKWNFTKFLIDRSGKPVARHGPRMTPEDLTDEIEKLLATDAPHKQSVA